MTDYSQFEAGLKSGIHAEPARIRKKDEIIRSVLKGTRRFLIVGLLFLAAAIGLGVYFYSKTGFHTSIKNYIILVLLFLGFAFCFLQFLRRRNLIGDDLREFYEEGLLVGALIIKTQPLTLMALSSLVAYDGAPDRYGCYKLVVHKLEGAKGELYEKIPCSCFFRYESGNYHEAFQPHPLHWGTADIHAISQALDKVEQENIQENQDIWGVIRRIAEEFPDSKDGQIVVLDENFNPIGIKYYWQTEMEPIETKESKQNSSEADRQFFENTDGQEKEREYQKKPQEGVLTMKDKPGKEVYEHFLQLACQHKVYDYLSGHCKNGSVENCTHPGFFNYIGDPVKFPQEVREREITLQMGEYPLFMGKYLVTNRGFYRKNQFIPWREADITVKTDFLDTIKIYVNRKFCTEFESNIKGYEDWEQMNEEDKSKIAKLEVKRVNEFLQEIKTNGV